MAVDVEFPEDEFIRCGGEVRGRPRIVLPRGCGGFAQLIIKESDGTEEPILRGWNNYWVALGAGEALRELDINFDTKYDVSIGGEIPLVRGDEYEIVGEGTMLTSSPYFYFGGEGIDYDLTPNRNHLIELLPYFPEGLVVKLGDEELGVGEGRK